MPPQAWLFLWPWPFSLICRSGVWCCCSASRPRGLVSGSSVPSAGAFGRVRGALPEPWTASPARFEQASRWAGPAPSGPSLRAKWLPAFSTLVQQMEIRRFHFKKRPWTPLPQGLDLPDVDYFCAVLATPRNKRSDHPVALSLSRTLSERRVVARKLKALTAESRAAARVLSFLPLFIIGLQALLNPQQLQFLINDPGDTPLLGTAR